MLVEQLDDQAGAEDGGQHVAEGVLPLDARRVLEPGALVGVGALVVPAERPAVEVPVLDRARLPAEDVGDGVELRQVEPSAGTQQVADQLGPAGQVGEPDQRAEAGVGDVEGATAERAARVVDVGLHELGIQARLRGDPAGGRDGLAREVEPGDPGAPPRPGQGVEAEVALEVDEVEPVDRAELVHLEGGRGSCVPATKPAVS